MFTNRSLYYVIGFVIVAAFATAAPRPSFAQIGKAENADIRAQDLVDEGARVIAVARAALAALPNNPVVALGARRAMRQWAEDYRVFRQTNDYDFNSKTKTQARLSRKLKTLFLGMGEMYLALKRRDAVPVDPFPDLEPKELPWTPDRRPDDDRVEKMGLDNPGGYVICHGAVPGAVGIQRDPDRQVRQSMAKECPHLVGGAGRN